MKYIGLRSWFFLAESDERVYRTSGTMATTAIFVALLPETRSVALSFDVTKSRHGGIKSRKYDRAPKSTNMREPVDGFAYKWQTIEN